MGVAPCFLARDAGARELEPTGFGGGLDGHGLAARHVGERRVRDAAEPAVRGVRQGVVAVQVGHPEREPEEQETGTEKSYRTAHVGLLVRSHPVGVATGEPYAPLEGPSSAAPRMGCSLAAGASSAPCLDPARESR